MAVLVSILFDITPAIPPKTRSIRPIAHPERTKTYDKESTPPPIAAEHRLKIAPLRLPFYSLLKVLS